MLTKVRYYIGFAFFGLAVVLAQISGGSGGGSGGGRGPTGPTGPTGPSGTAGPTGPAGSVVEFSGFCQGLSPSFSLSTPAANAPVISCISSGSALLGVAEWPNNTSNVTAQAQLTLPANFSSGNAVTARFWYISPDSGHATTVTPSYAVVAAGATIDNPTFTGVTPAALTANASSQQTMSTFTFNPTGAANSRLYIKVAADTTALTSGATNTWKLVCLRIEF